jgi:CDP-diacylglycerol pyrophosphatase
MRKGASSLIMFSIALAITTLLARSVSAGPPRPGAPAAVDELWNQVNLCIQAAIASGFKPVPVPPTPPIPTCIYIQPQGANAQIGSGFAILKDRDPHIYHFLTSATKAITGIEDPQVTFSTSAALVNTSYSPNYWTDAWLWLNATVNVVYKGNHKGVILRPDQMGLAINSQKGRTQNQLHIHMACLDKSVQTVLAKAQPPITTTWSAPIILKNNHSYHVILLANTSVNPFLLVKTVPGYKPTDPGSETLALTAKPGTTQYYLMEDFTHGSDPGHAEELLDEACSTQ